MFAAAAEQAFPTGVQEAWSELVVALARGSGMICPRYPLLALLRGEMVVRTVVVVVVGRCVAVVSRFFSYVCSLTVS